MSLGIDGVRVGIAAVLTAGAAGLLALPAPPPPPPAVVGTDWLPETYAWEPRTTILPGGRRIDWHEASDLAALNGAVFGGDGDVHWSVPGISDEQIAAARELLSRARDQRRRDEADAAQALRSGGRSLGETLFLINCGACHGATGRVVGPGVATLEVVPRSFADPAVLDALSDDYLRRLLREGGAAVGANTIMPAFPGLLDEDVEAIIRHLRTLPER